MTMQRINHFIWFDNSQVTHRAAKAAFISLITAVTPGTAPSCEM